MPYSGGGVYAYLFSGDQFTGGVPIPGATQNGEARLTITGSTVDNNQAGLHGGGVAICAKREDSDFDVRSVAEIINSTISTNTAGFPSGSPVGGEGGGVHIAIYNADTLDEEAIDVHLTHSTITLNKADVGGGVFSLVPTDPPRREVNTIVQHTIISGNNQHDGAADNFYGSINVTETKYSLISDVDPEIAWSPQASDVDNRFYDFQNAMDIAFDDLDPSNLHNDGTNDPGLASLRFLGGPTLVHRPLEGSPAIDAGNPLAVEAPMAFQNSTSAARHLAVFLKGDWTSVLWRSVMHREW